MNRNIKILVTVLLIILFSQSTFAKINFGTTSAVRNKIKELKKEIEENYSGAREWTMQWGTGEWDYGNCGATDSSGKIYVTGCTSGELDGNTTAGSIDIFLTKYDSDGNKLWTELWGTEGVDSGVSVSIDSSDNIYVTGYTAGDLDGNTSAGYDDIFLTKFDSDGNKLWTKQWGTEWEDIGCSIAIDGSDNIYVAGYTEGDLDGNTTAGSFDIFLTKYDFTGSKIWTRQWGTEWWDYGRSVSIDSSENLYVTGFTSGDLDGNTSSGDDDIFLTKYDSDGNKLWTRQCGTWGHESGACASIDSAGNIYITGYTAGGLNGNTSAGDFDIFLIKYDPTGNRLWTRQWGTKASDYGASVSIDSSDNIYVTGCTTGELDGKICAGEYDIFLTKYDSNGNKIVTRQWGTEEFDCGQCVSIDSSDNVYITGYTDGGLDGNTNSGSRDIFLSKWVF